MKQVLLIDAPPLFRDFLKEKLTDEKIGIETATIKRDAFTKLLSALPNLIIIDVETDVFALSEFLLKKISDPNTHGIPIIITGPKIERGKIAMLAQYGVVKYFAKPIKFDLFFESVGRVLRTAFSIDTTPCVMELHINDDIIFIEIAQGLNREKIAILKYKLPEIIAENHIDVPKIVLMMTDLELSFVDGANLEYLLDSLVSSKRIRNKHIKILSLSQFTRDLVDGHPDYDGIEIAENITDVLNSLVDSNSEVNLADVIAQKILRSDGRSGTGSVEIRFSSDTGIADKKVEIDLASDYSEEEQADIEESTVPLRIAVIDDDAVTLNVLSTAFKTVNAEVITFSSGSEFMKSLATQVFDLLILDIFMPGLSGFNILQNLQAKGFSTPILVYSQAVQRDSVVTALKLGARSYMVKPQKPMEIVQKAMEIIRM